MDPVNPAPDVLESQVHGEVPMPVTPSEGTEHPEGAAFDLPPGTDTPGMPRQTTATNGDSAQKVTETVDVPPGGLDLPGAGGN